MMTRCLEAQACGRGEAMSNAETFDKLFCSDGELQRRAEAALAAFDGDRSDAQAVFEAVIAPLAAEAGLSFAFEEGVANAARGMDIFGDGADAMAKVWSSVEPLE